MRVTCDKCRVMYDDAKAFTFCPHERFMSDQTAAQKDLGVSLVGKPLKWANEINEPTAAVLYIESVGFDGMVTLRGWTGEFAPTCFKVVRDGDYS